MRMRQLNSKLPMRTAQCKKAVNLPKLKNVKNLGSLPTNANAVLKSNA